MYNITMLTFKPMYINLTLVITVHTDALAPARAPNVARPFTGTNQITKLDRILTFSIINYLEYIFTNLRTSS